MKFRLDAPLRRVILVCSTVFLVNYANKGVGKLHI